jgi:hypothetical protein
MKRTTLKRGKSDLAVGPLGRMAKMVHLRKGDIFTRDSSGQNYDKRV